MPDRFKNFLEAEIRAIKASVGEVDESDPDAFTEKVMGWINRNAESFRREWTNSYGVTIDCMVGEDLQGSGGRRRMRRGRIVAQ